MKLTRRNFSKYLLGLSAASTAHALMPGIQSVSGLAASAITKFKLGIGTYTFRSLTLEEMVRQLKQLKIDAIELSQKPFWDIQTTKEEFAGAAKLFQENGIQIVSWFGPEIKNSQDAQWIVEMAKTLGVQHVSGDASGEGLKAIDEAFQKNNLYYGIHNHFFKGKKFKYESPEDILRVLSTTSKHVGSTLDTGHMVSCGHDPIQAFLKLKDRIRVIHLKDIEAPGNDQNVVFGTGKAKPDVVLKTLIQEGYSGLVAIEYEDEKNLQADVEKCVKFVRERI
jgi:sugar phosphate isomerase/epimerase